MLEIGDVAPWFQAQALSGRPRYAFDTVAGRWVLLLMLGSAAPEGGQAALRLVADNRDLFDDRQAAFFGVTIDPRDAGEGHVAQALPGIRWFLDYDRRISQLYGALEPDGEGLRYRAHWLLLDPMLRVAGRAPLSGGDALIAALRKRVTQPYALPAAPVLIVPDVLSRDLCARLIDTFERDGGKQSGFMRDEDGVTVTIVDPDHKRRADHTITDPALLDELKTRMGNVLRPLIHRAFQFDASRIERFIVARYDASERGHFRAHRDNTTLGTAHRRFACTINLNAEEFEGGDLCFPEFGGRTYRAPTGGAVVFSCSLMHEARPVTRGRRYAFLPFFYDEAGALVRERNLPYVGPELQGYRSGLADVPAPG